MKRLWLTLVLLAAVWPAGCSSSPDWEAKLDVPPSVQAEKASPFRLEVTGKQGGVAGLAVQAVLEMAKMDHDAVKVVFRESGKGVYVGEASLPMGGSWVATVTMEKEGKQKEQTIGFQVGKSANGPVATINGDAITGEDVDFYALANDVQAAIDGSAPTNAGGRNGLLTQMIRLRAVGMLAKEKGHRIDEREVAAQVDKAMEAGESDPDLRRRIGLFGTERFRRMMSERQTLLTLAMKVQSDVESKVRADLPEAPAGEIRFQTAKAYEELIVSQMSTLQVKLN